MTVSKTSLEAIKKLRKSGAIGKLQYQVLRFVYRNPVCTQNDVLRHYLSGTEGIDKGTYSARFAELERMKLIRVVGSKIQGSNRRQTYVTTNRTTIYKQTLREILINKEEKLIKIKKIFIKKRNK